MSGSRAKRTYDRFPSNIRSEEQEEKRREILAAARGAFEYIKHAPTYHFVCQVHVFSTSLYSNFHCVSLIPNFSHILTSSPSVPVGKDCLSPMQRRVSSIFDDWCNCNVVLENGNYQNDEHMCFEGRKGAHGFGH